MRNPAAVAQSLKTRSGLSLRFGLKLREQYFEHLLSIPRERIEAQVRYEELVSDPKKVARDLVCSLRLESELDRTRMASSSVKAELARNRGRLESLPASIDSHSISRAYAQILAHGPELPCSPLVDTVTNTMRRLGSHRKSRPGTGHSPPIETEIQLPDQENIADEVETSILQTRKALADTIRAAAWRTLKAFGENPDGAQTGQLTARLAELTHAFASLEGQQHEASPSTRQKTVTPTPTKTNWG